MTLNIIEGKLYVAVRLIAIFVPCGRDVVYPLDEAWRTLHTTQSYLVFRVHSCYLSVLLIVSTCAMSNVIYQNIERFIDNRSGEITESRKCEVVRHPAEPPYIKLYIDELCALIEVPSSHKRLLLLLLRKLDYDGYITLSTRYRRQICDILGVKDQTFRNRLRELVKYQLLLHEGLNEYQANPFYFARGEWKKIVEQRQAFQMKIVYTPQGKSVTTEVYQEG